MAFLAPAGVLMGWEREGRALQGKAHVLQSSVQEQGFVCPSMGRFGADFMGQSLWQTHRHFPVLKHKLEVCREGSQPLPQFRHSLPPRMEKPLVKLIFDKASFTTSSHVAALNATQGLKHFFLHLAFLAAPAFLKL